MLEILKTWTPLEIATLLLDDEIACRVCSIVEAEWWNELEQGEAEAIEMAYKPVPDRLASRSISWAVAQLRNASNYDFGEILDLALQNQDTNVHWWHWLPPEIQDLL